MGGLIYKIKKTFEDNLRISSIISKQLTIQKYREFALHGDTLCGVDDNESVIISLTTYSKRIHEVYLTIESLFQQTQQARRIILWLAKEEFSQKEIPLILRRQQDRGLEIRFCEDIRQYKKLVPALSLFPNHPIITVDDDYIYPIDFIERLLGRQRKYPKCVCYYIGARIEFQNNGVIKSYTQWGQDDKREYIPSILNFSTGAGGVLYPPHCFHEDVRDALLFNKFAPRNDDIWFKAMTLRNNIQYVKIPIECGFAKKFILLEDGQDIALYHHNVERGENDVQIKNTFEYYELIEKLQHADK